MSLQHPARTETRVRSEAGLQGVMLAPVLVGDFGGGYEDGPQVVFDEKSFWQKFMKSIRVLGKEIELAPTPRRFPRFWPTRSSRPMSTISACVSSSSGSRPAASPADILALTRQLGNQG